MAASIKPYKNSEQSKKDQIRRMFDNISCDYDQLNRVISFGIDNAWRKKVIEWVSRTNPKSILDVATGTGDLALMFKNSGAEKIVGLDLSPGMLEIGRKKVISEGLTSLIDMVVGDSEQLPFEDNTFDAITVSFGIRNFEDLELGLSEIRRVLRPGGIFVILETSVPTKFPYKQGYKIYTQTLLPTIGRIFSKDKVAYQYLSDSAAVFPYGEALNNILRKVGFTNVVAHPQTFGVATIYTAGKS
ncbi:bifunctional demethylmenaquinone methyltransferase/2-methoxy-6-polyprenyl-1,4-benzoquinol methylase UbiE [Flavobacterium aurantiibacter]|uniref:Demethylmenaquinone methyltransferase n=1 Tax=Flavobacterium aurantiibacter TaxID=2023067 RepID=A0A255ZS07_9FLAO|nr:bifunctional demethylmenaquinone methyltransferase/2-methoxy-6-polyprenyl-1,4-benzoquinol methylase UbiE [Flavobacterium aurantiibacter]OYQ43704.1 bifunctional demethylmenaquinone methyltransferase/2-methoxy-6-polyprenyl-1,4-benzoquinol methylase [Flavobacterium aurantiibacter]